MKKGTPILIVALIIFFALTVGGIFLAFKIASSKTTLTQDQFISKLENKGFLANDDSEQFMQYDYITSVAVASPSDLSYQIQFFTFLDESYAQKFYETNKSTFSRSASSDSPSVRTSGTGFDKFNVTTSNEFMEVSRIQNTCIYLKVDKAYKDDVKNVLKSLGY